MRDTTVQSIAFAAGLAAGFWESYEALVHQRQINHSFSPGIGRHQALANFVTWLHAVERAKHWVE